MSVDPASGDAAITSFQFGAVGSTDPDGDPLTYQWDFDGNGSFDGNGFTASHIYPQPGTYAARLRVTDPRGAFDEATTLVDVSNTPPVATITAPTRRVGDTLTAGTGTDAEDGALVPDAPGREWEWTVILHHCPDRCHQHIEAVWSGIAGGTFLVPDHEYPSYLEFVMNVEDAVGATATDRVEVHPESSTLTFVTDPPGLEITAGGSAAPIATPFELPSLEGSQITIGGPSPQQLDGTTYLFAGWSDGGAATHDVIVPTEDPTLTATFTPRPPDVPGMVDGDGRWQLVDAGGPVGSLYFGVGGDVPLAGDWDCDGIDTPGAYRRSTGLVYLRNSNTTGVADHSFIFGIPGDIPVPGDFDGDGCDTVSVYRPGTCTSATSSGRTGACSPAPTPTTGSGWPATALWSATTTGTASTSSGCIGPLPGSFT